MSWVRGLGRRRRARRPDPELEWGISADLGDDFYPLPLERDADEFGAEVVEILRAGVPEELGRPITRERAEVLASEFVTMLRQVQQSEASMASLYRPALDAPMLALLSTHIHPGDPEQSLEEWARRACVPVTGRADVARVRLAVGDAVRVHVTSDLAPAGESAVVESVSHVFEAVSGQVVHHRLSWTDPSADSEELVRMADRVAQQLAYE
jgi:hypothetical protein